MYNLWQMRKTCLTAIRQCEQAEQRAKQVQAAASQQRQIALADARQRHTQARQGAEAAVKEVRNLADQGKRLLAALNLTPEPPPPFTVPSGAGLDELARLLQNQRMQAREALNRLQASAEALKEERRKWWKFW